MGRSNKFSMVLEGLYAVTNYGWRHPLELVLATWTQGTGMFVQATLSKGTQTSVLRAPPQTSFSLAHCS
jgi:hypothetical protein